MAKTLKEEEPIIEKVTIAKREDLTISTNYSTSMKTISYNGKVVLNTYLTDDNLVVKEALDIINGTETI